MKRAVGVSLLLAVAVVAAGLLVHVSGLPRGAVAAPPLVLDPELLKEGLPEDEKREKLKVDNSACYVCHGNYDGEELVVTHGKEEVGCIDCHGESNDHRNDEDNITPPDTMYALVEVDDMCGECHDSHDATAREVLERWQQRCPDKAADEVVCTDCHFHHRLERRVVRWNKKTGEVISRQPEQEAP